MLLETETETTSFETETKTRTLETETITFLILTGVFDKIVLAYVRKGQKVQVEGQKTQNPRLLSAYLLYNFYGNPMKKGCLLVISLMLVIIIVVRLHRSKIFQVLNEMGQILAVF